MLNLYKLLKVTGKVVLIIFFSCSCLTASALDASPSKIKLTLFWKHQFEFAGFYAAIAQGYYKEKGIEVEFIEFRPEVNTITSVVTGETDFALAGSDLIQSFHEGADVKLLASYFKRSPLVLVTQPNITSLTTLANSKVYGQEKLIYRGSIREMLNLHGVSPDSITPQITGDPIALFQSKSVDGLLAYITDGPYQLSQRKIPYNIFDPNQFGIATQDYNLFTSTRFAQQHPVLTKHFTEATNRGWQYALDHPDEIIELIKAKYNA